MGGYGLTTPSEEVAMAEANPAQGDRDDKRPTRGRPLLRRYLTVSWIVTILVFTVVRLVVARGTLEKYGLNIWVFGALDLATAVPYAVGVARVVTALVDRQVRQAGRWAMVAVVAFLAPYIYVAWVGKDAQFPPAVYVALAVLVVAFGMNAVWGTIRKVRAVRRSESPIRAGERVPEIVLSGMSGPGPLVSGIDLPDTGGNPRGHVPTGGEDVA